MVQGMYPNYSIRCLRRRFRANSETIFRKNIFRLAQKLQEIENILRKKKIYSQKETQTTSSFFLELSSSTLSKIIFFCRVVLHLTLPACPCLGNKSENELKHELKPNKILVNICISKLTLGQCEKNPATNRNCEQVWSACKDFSYFLFLETLIYSSRSNKCYLFYQTIPNFQVDAVFYAYNT